MRPYHCRPSRRGARCEGHCGLGLLPGAAGRHHPEDHHHPGRHAACAQPGAPHQAPRLAAQDGGTTACRHSASQLSFPCSGQGSLAAMACWALINLFVGMPEVHAAEAWSADVYLGTWCQGASGLQLSGLFNSSVDSYTYKQKQVSSSSSATCWAIPWTLMRYRCKRSLTSSSSGACTNSSCQGVAALRVTR